MSMMSNGRVLPNSRMGTSGLQVDENIKKGQTLWVMVPDRIASTSIEVNIPKGQSAAFKIEYSVNSYSTIGEDGKGGFWHNPFGKDDEVYKEWTHITVVNNVSAVRVICLEASDIINVCIKG